METPTAPQRVTFRNWKRLFMTFILWRTPMFNAIVVGPGWRFFYRSELTDMFCDSFSLRIFWISSHLTKPELSC